MIKNVLLDVDGVLWQHGKIIKGAKEAIRFLEENKYNYLIVTNLSRMTKKELSKKFAKSGLKIGTSKIMTPLEATIDFVKAKKSKPICYLVSAKEIKKEFGKAGVKVTEKENADFVCVFWHEGTDYTALDGAFQALVGGAELVAANIVKSAPINQGGKNALGPGAFVKGLEYASGKTATVIGKPNVEFFKAALLGLSANAEETIMVGDNLEADIIGAKNTGIAAVLVKTGNFNKEELEKSNIKPDAVIGSIADLPRFLRENK